MPTPSAMTTAANLDLAPGSNPCQTFLIVPSVLSLSYGSWSRGVALTGTRLFVFIETDPASRFTRLTQQGPRHAHRSG